MNPITATGTKGFLMWVKQSYPSVYAEVAKRMNAGLQTMAGLGDDSAMLSESYGGVDYSMTQNPPVSVSMVNDPAATASTASTSSAVASSLNNIVNTAANVVLGLGQQQLQQTVLSTQLARAQAGLPPLNLQGSSMSPLVLIGGLALIAFLVLDKK
jgi:hypothetical protein